MRTHAVGDRVSGLEIDVLLRAQSGIGVVLAAPVTVASGDNLSIIGGIGFNSRGSLSSIQCSASYALPARDTNYTKWCVVYADLQNQGALSTATGIASANPELPGQPASPDMIPLCAAQLPKTGGAAVTLYDLLCPIPNPRAGWHEDWEWIDTDKYTNSDTGTIVTGTVLRVPTTSYACWVGSRATSTCQLVWNTKPLWMRCLVKCSSDNAMFGFINPVGNFSGTSYAAILQMGGIGGGWYLATSAGGGSNVVDLSTVTDTNWHLFDVVFGYDTPSTYNVTAWIDGVYKGKSTATLPAVGTNLYWEVMVPATSKQADVAFFQVVDGW